MEILNRAKSIYSDEYFISSDIKFELGMMYLRVKGVWGECEKATRSIHIGDMIDSNGTRIFASLRKDGKSGDILRIEQLDEDEPFEDRTVVYDETSIRIKNYKFDWHCNLDMINLEFAKVIGIQQ